MHVLIADDDERALTFLKGRLTAWGHTVTTAGDGVGALRALVGDPGITTVILNWMMPRMDGWRLSRQIKANTAGRVRTIVVVGVAFRQVARDAFGSWADDYIGKPFDTNELKASLAAAAGALAEARRNDRVELGARPALRMRLDCN